MTIKIDKKRALALLDEVVAEAGSDHTQVSCTYVERDENLGERLPGCIVGRALFKAGVDLDDLEDLDRGGGSKIRYCYTRIAGLEITPVALSILQSAQDVQDGDFENDRTWGAALAKVREE